MNETVRQILDKVATTCDFSEFSFNDINETSINGDNALHCVVGWGDLEAALELIRAGINVNQHGDLGYTPLHVACMRGHAELVRLLVENGANLFAPSEGYPPFTYARQFGHNAICDYLAPLMKKATTDDPNAYLRSRIDQLWREIAKLEIDLKKSENQA